MRELTYYAAVSLDGFIADCRGRTDAFLVEGDHGGVVFGDYADALPGHALEALGITPPGTVFDTVVMGARTMQPALDAGIGSPYPHLRQVVASRSGRSFDPAIQVTGDPVATVRELKRAGGLGIWLCGGGELAGALVAEIDRLVLKRNPIAFGTGVSLFGGRPVDGGSFELCQARSFRSGVVVEEYARAT